MHKSKLLKIVVTFLSLVILCCAMSEYQITKVNKTDSSAYFELQYRGTDQYYVKPTSPIIKNLKFQIKIYGYYDFSFKITDINSTRFQIPQVAPFLIDPMQNFTFPLSQSSIEFTYNEYPFDFMIKRKGQNTVIFSTYEKKIIFSKYYMQIGTEVDSQYIYGLGERFEQSLKKDSGKWTIFNRDRGEVIDIGIGLQTYGSYPVYLLRQKKFNFHVGYFRNSHAMDVIIQKQQSTNKSFMNFKTIGGVLDFRFFIGQNDPINTLISFHKYLGRSMVPPFWSLGYHQSRWGYKNASVLESVIDKFQSLDIPLDTIWSDLDYLINAQPFVINNVSFPFDQMANLTKRINYVPILDPGIKLNPDKNSPYTPGKQMNAFIQDAAGGDFIGRLRPGNVSFIDFFSSNSSKYWNLLLESQYNKIPFSGLWIDMNEYTSYCSGQCVFPQNATAFDYSKDLPYAPGFDQLQGDTISLNATLGNGKYLQAEVHNFAAMLQAHVTYNYLKTKNDRPFLLTRSGTLGSNRYAIHWSGDNQADFYFLKTSLIDNINNQIWGYQMMGADICGFSQNAKQEICARWYQLGSMYPFSRNHNSIHATDQEPYALGDVVIEAAKNNLKFRYSILKHYYSLFVDKNGYGTIWNSLFFVFPDDQSCYLNENADTQFLIDSFLLFTPILEQGTKSRSIYLPKSNWYLLPDPPIRGNPVRYESGKNQISDILLTSLIPTFLRQNSILFQQNVQKVLNTKQLNAMNIFTITAGFKLNRTLSNSTYEGFSSNGKIMSIQDYQNQTKISSCLKNGCFYNFYMTLMQPKQATLNQKKPINLKNVEQSARYIQIIVQYKGQSRMNETIQFSKIIAYLPTQTTTIGFKQPLKITQSDKIIIDLGSLTPTVKAMRNQKQEIAVTIKIGQMQNGNIQKRNDQLLIIREE